MKYDRTLRISGEIKKIISSLLASELKDPGLSLLTTVTKVHTTGDLRYSNIYISVLNSDEAESTIAALNRAKGFIRREIGSRLSLRYTPEPIFKYDDSIEYSQHMSDLISSVNEN